MTEAYILDKVSALRPNPYGSYLGDYLKSLDLRIRTELLCENDPSYTPDKLALDDKDFAIYELFLFSVIDLLNGEYGRHENSRGAFEDAYSELLKRYAKPAEDTDTSVDTKPEENYERSFRIW